MGELEVSRKRKNKKDVTFTGANVMKTKSTMDYAEWLESHVKWLESQKRKLK